MKHHFTERIPHTILFILLALSSFFASAQEIEGDAANGKALFNSNCASCHSLDRKMIGPALEGVTERRDMDWLLRWIKDNQELRAAGDATAIAIFEEYNGSVMPAFPGLSDQDVKDILVYTSEGGAAAQGPQDVSQGVEADAPEEKDNTAVLLTLGVILLFLVGLLVRVKNTLKKIKGEPTYTLLEDTDRMTRMAAQNPKIMILTTLIVAIVFFQQLYFGLMGIGVTESYQPAQPIKFSHKLHAGENQINCNYCHYGARKGKHSNIPPAGVCMNCHMYIQEGPNYGTEEISKIYAAVGWDPENSAYIEGYEEKPIKWVRIHNLPDFTYFNHSQHVTAGQVDCQACHGPIQEMEEVYQYSPLTMGWCVDCHRTTKVQVESNDYYAEMHKKLKEKYGEDAEITVEMIGGLECSKCHY